MDPGIAAKERLEEHLLQLAEDLTRKNAILMNGMIRIAQLLQEGNEVSKEQIYAIFIDIMAKISQS
jgi:hypothetical protein